MEEIKSKFSDELEVLVLIGVTGLGAIGLRHVEGANLSTLLSLFTTPSPNPFNVNSCFRASFRFGFMALPVEMVASSNTVLRLLIVSCSINLAGLVVDLSEPVSVSVSVNGLVVPSCSDMMDMNGSVRGATRSDGMSGLSRYPRISNSPTAVSRL